MMKKVVRRLCWDGEMRSYKEKKQPQVFPCRRDDPAKRCKDSAAEVGMFFAGGKG